IFTLIPRHYWSVSPDPKSVSAGEQRLLLRGAVLLHLSGRTAPATADSTDLADGRAALSPELAAALDEKPQSPLRAIWGYLAADGLLAPAAVGGAVAIAAAAMVVEALLLRGIFDIGALLNTGSQRLAAVLALLAFMGLVLAFRIPIVT